MLSFPVASVYLKKCDLIHGLETHLLSLENVFFRSRLVLTHTLRNNMEISIQVLNVHFLTNQIIKYN